ncbi:hypothetical protein K470DRAFT_270429 [Piedraia hortae CBS 480.64]|uniref:Uncharacterized protein n=1 Tax=Piedraia hortae CBS 480.64 TaxID=1314780 RepID=A0A6A7C0Q6_9PEZI|nr:hypothetical protein K470DRAFT_270429 [Piedraia hortae CBS 480.64]
MLSINNEADLGCCREMQNDPVASSTHANGDNAIAYPDRAKKVSENPVVNSECVNGDAHPDTSKETPDELATDANDDAVNGAAHNESTNHKTDVNVTNVHDTFDEDEEREGIKIRLDELDQRLNEDYKFYEGMARFLAEASRYLEHMSNSCDL